jgi:hypothetical protein
MSFIALPYIMVPAEEGADPRKAGFDQLIANTGLIPDVPSESGSIQCLTLLGVVFLIEREGESLEAAKTIRVLGPEPSVEALQELPETRRQAAVTLFAQSFYFGETVRNDAMAMLLTLLACLAMEGRTEVLFERVLPVVAEAARDRKVWDRIMELMPDLCTLLEEEWGKRPDQSPTTPPAAAPEKPCRPC